MTSEWKENWGALQIENVNINFPAAIQQEFVAFNIRFPKLCCRKVGEYPN